VLNLGLNALDASATSSGERAVVVRTEADGDHAEVTVQDSGPGIPADVQARVFEPFFSTKADGLGFGLAVVRSIAERHHGRAWARNHTMGGAVFGVVLPLTRAAAPANDATITPRSDQVAR
jgi:signal transduction histidine kinase